jgi:hypothetical protein
LIHKFQGIFKLQYVNEHPVTNDSNTAFDFILIEKFSGKYCDGKFESVLINCFKKIVTVEVCVVTVTKPENSRNIEVYAL